MFFEEQESVFSSVRADLVEDVSMMSRILCNE